ncbi:MFS transporter [Nocardioides sp. CPCC 205120]|uniref:MFS transporter n=1 Tax=Nocardioides sp. CPCC 205120 TaxID=3406462 RepID=UPI003B5003F1
MTTTSPAGTAADLTGQGRNLALATFAFVVSFWAWNLVGPLGVRYAQDLDLTGSEKSLLVAIPVLVGSLGRIIAGAMTDRYGGRVMFPLLLAASAPFVLLVAFAGERGSYPLLLVFGFFLGVAGTTFAVGVPFVNAWYDAPRRGFATGVFGAGMGGTALSSFFTPRLVESFGYTTTHVLVAVALVLTAVLCWAFLRDSPRWTPNHNPVLPKLALGLRLPVTWRMSFLYAVTFGGFVAFSTYLPTYLTDVYAFDLTGAGTRTAGFAIAAVLARPLGGVLADKVGPRTVVMASLAGTAVLAVVVALEPPAEVPAGIAFVLLALFLGLGTGGVFAWVAVQSPPEKVGTVTGLVGAAGGLGGFFPPLVMGATYGVVLDDYGLGLALLVVVALGALLFTARQPAGRGEAGRA